MAVDRAFWAGRRVLVTGHTGFKGAWLCLWLQRLGARVTGFALESPTRPSLFEIARVADGIDSVTGDVRDFDCLADVIARSRAEVIIHMAAQALVRASYADPVGTYATNVMGTVNLLEAARRASARVIINVTSDKCYENVERSSGYRETDALGGSDPYSSSKACSEMVIGAYRRSFFSAAHGDAALASARAGNVIGGGDWAVDRLIPDFCRAVQADKELVLRNPTAVRPWQYVLDPLCGYLMLAQRMWQRPTEFSEAWNFGPPEADTWAVARVIELLSQAWGRPVRWRFEGDQQLHESQFLKLDCGKARTRLGWRPRVTLEAALERITSWLRAYLARADMRQVSLDQIALYERQLQTL